MDCCAGAYFVAVLPIIHYSANPTIHFRPARGLRGIAEPPDSESGSLGRASRLAPTIFKAAKALSAMHSLGRRAYSVQLRVGDPVLVAVCQGGHAPASQSSQRSSRFHKPAPPRAALGIETILEWIDEAMDFWIVEKRRLHSALGFPAIQYSTNPYLSGLQALMSDAAVF